MSATSDCHNTASADANSAVYAKQLQNRNYKQFGLGATIAGLIGFSPSFYKIIRYQVIWSVSNDAPHTDTDFLLPHGIAMAVWFFATFLQIWSGGVPDRRKVHIYVGRMGSLALAIGMALAAANTIKYDGSQPGAAIYTVCLILLAFFNLGFGVLRACQKRFAEHKDFMIMAIMVTLDPAVHRLFMWCIRIAASRYGVENLSPDLVLALGKMPANFFLVTFFGAMVIRARRVNWVTVFNLSFQVLGWIFGMVLTFTHIDDGKEVCVDCVGAGIWVSVLIASVVFFIIIGAFVVTELRLRAKAARGWNTVAVTRQALVTS